jgi:DNA-binding transcriptional LysR family regulator
VSRHNGGVYAWEFEKRGRAVKVRVEGQLVFNTLALRMEAALDSFGLAYLPEDQVQAHLAAGKLIQFVFSPTGVRLFLAITSTTQAAGRTRRHSRCSSKRCATGADPSCGPDPSFGLPWPFWLGRLRREAHLVHF